MIKKFFSSVKDENLQEIDEVRTGIWVHAESPSREEIEGIQKEFDLDPAILEDAQDFFEVPRFERSSGGSYFFVRYPYDDKEEDIDTAPMLIVVGESFVITVVQREAPFLKPLLDGKEKVNTTQKTKLFLQMMSALTSGYERELVRMRKAVHKDRFRIRKISARDIERLVKYEHTLNDAVSALVPTNAWLQQVLSGNHLQLFTEDVELIEDLMIANNQLVESSKSVLKTIQNIRSATEAILTNSLNTTIKILTALTILLTIPTLVSSLYGMNVSIPFADDPRSFWLVITFIATVVALVFYFFKRSEWL